MILLDLNQVMLANLMVQLGNHKNAEVDTSTLRHMILNSLRFNNSKFKTEYGEMIVCSDDSNFWRKKYFPYYKGLRKANRDNSELNWNEIFASLSIIKEEIATILPYKLIQVATAEADDVIGTICHLEGKQLNDGSKKILIISGDKDFKQLHVYANVNQYDPVKKKFVTVDDPEDYLKELIIKGDGGDGVPNIMSPDNTFMIKLRQGTITQKRLDAFKRGEMTEEIARNYRRNELMIDLSKIPDDIKSEIAEKFYTPNTKNRSLLLNYFIKHKLSLLIDLLGDF